jgi:hypothetical protein
MQGTIAMALWPQLTTPTLAVDSITRLAFLFQPLSQPVTTGFLTNSWAQYGPKAIRKSEDCCSFVQGSHYKPSKNRASFSQEARVHCQP